MSNMKNRLKSFISHNEGASLKEAEYTHYDWKIENPWNDETLEIRIPKDDSRKAVTLLNKLWLPEQLSAIYHIKKKKLEVIWTAYNLGPIGKSIKDRDFVFQLDGKSFNCNFGPASKDLIFLSELTFPVAAPGHSGYRNLQTYWRSASKRTDDTVTGEPRSFWISDAPMNHGKLISIVRNLNFYIKYYDSHSPTVLVHPPKMNESHKKIRFRDKKFPKNIRASHIDENLLVFWNPPIGADHIVRFLHYYKIIEYCAYLYIQDTVRAQIKRIISRPNSLDNTDLLLADILSKINQKQLDEHTRAKMLLQENVDRKTVWEAVKQNRSFFEAVQKFDGGFKTNKPLICKKSTEETFKSNALEQFYYTVKSIRNALSHGKDIETTGSILPTRKNEELLKPWVNVLEIIAGDVILHNK